MSMKPKELPVIPEQTQQVARAAFPRGNMLMRMRDELGQLYRDETFADLYPTRGQAGLPAALLALVVVFQYLEGQTDRQAADAVRGRIDWKYALGLELTDAGFDYSVLSEFRARLVAGGAEQRLLDEELKVFQGQGLVKARGRQRTDSTHVLASTHQLNRLELAAETLRSALNELAEVVPDWLSNVTPAEWFDRYGRRWDAWRRRMPAGQAARQEQAAVIGADGYKLAELVRQADTPAEVQGEAAQVALEVLRQVWVQQYYIDADGVVSWRDEKLGQAPRERRLDTPYDVDVRYAKKGSTEWDGYKVHMTETCDPPGDEPTLHAIVHVATTPATTADVAALTPIHTALQAKALLPNLHFLDGGYVDAGELVAAAARFGVTIIGPAPQDSSWQARARTGYDQTAFQIDWAKRQATCPHGHLSTSWAEDTLDRHGNPIINVLFSRKDCRVCPAKPVCTRGEHRQLMLRPHDQYEALKKQRAAQAQPEHIASYRTRAGIEGTISQGVRTFDMRRSRYIGQSKTDVQMQATAAAINIERWADMRAGYKPAHTRYSCFARLAPA